MILLIVGRLSYNWDDSPCNGMISFNFGRFFLYWDDCLQIGMILCILGALSSTWDVSPYSGMIVFKLE